MADQNVSGQSYADAFSGNPLLARFFQSPEQRDNIENGKRIIKAFYGQQIASSNTYNNWITRSRRWMEVLLWAKGSQPMQEFLDYMSVSDANKAWVNIDMTQQRVAAQFVGTLVEAMAKNKIYPCVDAVDDGSISEKEQRMFDALYRMYDQQTINQMQQASGMQLEPPNAFVPHDELSARVYFKLEDRLPKEIRFEELLLKLQQDIKFDKVLNRKGIYDIVTVNLEATKIERLAPKCYTVRKCQPTNMVYNFFMNDTGDLEITMIGEFRNIKVGELRSKFGKSPDNPDGLTEDQIFELAKLSSMKNIGKFSYIWNSSWASPTWQQNRPYDDCNILVLDCEIDCPSALYFVSKKDNYGKEDIQQKKGVPYQQQKKDGTIIEQPKPADTEITQGKVNTWMRGVYAPYGDVMLYWGRPDLIICPYTDVYRPLSSYSINIPNNDGEYVPSLFERLLEPLREYTTTKLKRKQLIAQLRPSGIRIDVESARDIDLGNGDSIDWEEVLRIFNQTGTELWSSKGLDPLERTAPSITNTAADDAIIKIVQLTNVMASQIAEMRMLVGTSVFLEGGDLGDRTAAKLAEGQIEQANNVFGYIVNGHNQLWEETFTKICLLHWNDIVKEEPESKEDMLNTRFDITVKMKSTDYEKEQLEADIQRYSQVPDAQGNPSVTLKDAMMIREIDDAKLARWYLVNTYEENRRKAMEEAAAREQSNAKVQQDSLAMKAQADEAAAQQQALMESKIKEAESKEKKEQIALQGFFDLYKGGIPIPPSLAQLEQMVMKSVALSLGIENMQTETSIVEGVKQDQQDQQAEQMQAEQDQQAQAQQPIQQSMPQNQNYAVQ